MEVSKINSTTEIMIMAACEILWFADQSHFIASV